MKQYLAAAVILLAFGLAGCGGGGTQSYGYQPKFVGIVTAKIPPCVLSSGGYDDTQCVSEFRVIVEPFYGHKYTDYDGWYEKWSEVCVGPRYYRKLHIGSRFDSKKGDLHCDG